MRNEDPLTQPLVASEPQQGACHAYPPAAPDHAFHTPHRVVLTKPAVAEENFTSVSANEHPTATSGRCGPLPPFQMEALLRKEVIQPHLPVRLPCYDFVPIASPTFDDSLHKGWATGFGCYRLS